MIQLINKTDFIGVVPMSVNVPSANVDLHRKDAQSIDTIPIMPTRTGEVSIVTDIENTNAGARPQLFAFYNSVLKPYMICMAHARFLLWQGNNITQFGIVMNQEDTSDPVSDRARAELIASSEHKANVYLAQVTSALKAANYTFDTVVYSYESCADKPRAKTRIHAV